MRFQGKARLLNSLMRTRIMIESWKSLTQSMEMKSIEITTNSAAIYFE